MPLQAQEGLQNAQNLLHKLPLHPWLSNCSAQVVLIAFASCLSLLLQYYCGYRKVCVNSARIEKEEKRNTKRGLGAPGLGTLRICICMHLDASSLESHQGTNPGCMAAFLCLPWELRLLSCISYELVYVDEIRFGLLTVSPKP